MTAVLNSLPAPSGVRAGAFGNATHLICRACGEQSPLGPFYACMECFGPLEVGYEFPAITREQIEAGPKSIWRYAPLLPVPADIQTFRSTDPGYTRLVDARNLADDLGLKTALGEGRLGQSDPLVQGSGGRRRPVGRPRTRTQGACLPLDRQSGQRRGCGRGPRRHHVGRAGAEQPRAAEDHRLSRVRHDLDRGRGQLRRREQAGQ